MNFQKLKGYWQNEKYTRYLFSGIDNTEDTISELEDIATKGVRTEARDKTSEPQWLMRLCQADQHMCNWCVLEGRRQKQILEENGQPFSKLM